MKKKLIKFLIVIAGLYAVLCCILYFYQEKLIFFPQKLEKNYEFHFNQNFVDLSFETADGKFLNGLLFKSKNTKGLIFYLHGNSGALNTWGNVAKTYTDLNYDVFLLDYRGYGKSEGEISGQEQLYQDNQIVYDKLLTEYKEEDVIILGYSIGTGLASKLASENNAKRLILQAPYYSLTDLIQEKFWFVPAIILKYKFSTNEYLKNCKMPISIFHGNLDNTIPYESSLKLKREFKSQIELIELDGQGHNGMTENNNYRKELRRILIE